MSSKKEKFTVVGRFGAPFGVKGWLKIQSFTVPMENILQYQPWYADFKNGLAEIKILASRKHHKEIVVQISSCDSREATAQYRNVMISVQRDALPNLRTNQYYWTDLEGLTVRTEDGTGLGKIEYLLATGANDVLVVKGEKEHLIPFLPDAVIKKVDLDQQEIIVNWDPEF